MEDSFTLSLENFKGPFEVLLDMVEKNQLDIGGIALASVADEYVHYISNKERVPLSQASHFTTVASTLLLLKSRTLIPEFEITEEEKEDISDLKERLQMYTHIRKLAREMHKHWRKVSFTRAKMPKRLVVFSPSSDITLSALQSTAKAILDSQPTFETKTAAEVKNTIRLEDVVKELEERIKKYGSCSFSSFTSQSKEEKVKNIVTFMALLELVRNEMIEVSQQSTFGDIQIEYDSIETPSY